MSQITTHILDTSKGKPAAGVRLILEKQNAGKSWDRLAECITNTDGRAPDLLKNISPLEPGVFRFTFGTGEYFKKSNTVTIYPKVIIVFEIIDEGHYHVPLLLSPFGYSTYRGS